MSDGIKLKADKIQSFGKYVTRSGATAVVEAFSVDGDVAYGYTELGEENTNQAMMWCRASGEYAFNNLYMDIVRPYVEAKENTIEEAASFNLILPHVFTDRLGDAIDAKTKLGILSTGASLARMANSVGIDDLEEIGMGEYNITITKV